MRLIDADAFIQFLKDTVKRQKYENLKIGDSITVADVIEAIICDLDGTGIDGFTNAPTIEPQRTGEWIREQNGWYRCSECGDHHPSVRDCIDYDFCPRCGARMYIRKDGD